MHKKPPVSEEELVQKCKLGDLKYQERLYKHFYGYAMGVGLRYLSNRDDVLEVVNDSFIKVFKAIQFFNETQPFKAWLRRIIVNTAIDHRRKNLKHMNNGDLEEAAYLGKAPDAVDQLSAKDILKLLDRLPEVHRMVFNLYEIDGYSHEEIGSMLAIPVSSSRVYLSRAKEKLRKYLNQQQEMKYEGSV
ncbi:RNA polymerase sigma factor [Pedobacter sp. SYSU D00535]|uniref:RNA polymerase sigma factor n=1 Tax=Pedobacter sp. SYSU D00535 TaxID=2810308 RepID=UPI001A9671F2|nr:RNA polymerase sigma factor [Pedobacter sp. SYSU D00535]